MTMAWLNATMESSNRTYSPIALSQEWSRVSRLMFVFILCVFGTIMNGFFIASFFVENKLSKKGNVFLALVGVADFMITAGVMPVSVVVLVSGQYDNPDVCHALQFITEVSTYTFSMFFMLSAIENYCQMGCSSVHTRKFVNLAVNPGILLVYGASISASAYGVYNGYDYDYCQRLHHGHYNFRAYTSIFLHFVPCIITVTFLLISTLHVKQQGVEEVYYRRSQRYDDDYSRTILNILTYFLYVITWTPYLIIIYQFPKTSDSRFYQYAWLGICRSVLTSIFYSTLSSDFRRAYGFLINYCFCKTTVTGSYYSRNRRAARAAATNTGVNVMAQDLSPERSVSPPRENLEL